MSKVLEAVLMIANHPVMSGHLMPRIDIEAERIDWEDAQAGLSGGQKTLLSWAWCIWNDRQIPEKESAGFSASLETGWNDSVSGFGDLEPELQALVLRALAHRHSR